jgi:hypothetical protein
MTFVDVVTDRLADQVSANRVALQIVARQHLSFSAAISIVGNRLVDFEMVAPTGQFDTVVSEIGHHAAEVVNRKIGPLASKECDWTRHDYSLQRCELNWTAGHFRGVSDLKQADYRDWGLE